ncbi:uncharacterized protein BKA55DRAFT_698815 [Fusarium redolens]|uniref:LysM domain-containing protein n=1 Tax=Fusarium redolens TaxID=48865 RepID=A0A9P9FU91_FUSRE|nr:uncharacterized protein BKA55DRAFT_698815 [Fusarium redolens]KAH7202901.1 hypothetical protein BKA55DRAFT_698815 [Fusarium redolens]
MAILKPLLTFCLVASASAFRIYESDDLNTVGTACASALSADIACNPYIHDFMSLRYRFSLENVTLTDEICVPSCSSSLRQWFNSVSKECTGDEWKSTMVPTVYGGNIWAGWNETCVKDPKTKKYCNDIISEFPELGEKMAKEDLCHPCYRRRLALMQSSQYSVYNEDYKKELERIYKICGGSGPTEIPPPLTRKDEEEEEEEFCLNDKWYTTKEGDTCDSISKAAGVSGGLLYMGNQELIRDCHKIPEGLKLCLPTVCKTYYVKPEDTCLSIEIGLGIRWDTIRKYNSWVDRDCNNLQGGTDFYGKSVCIGPLGTADALAQLRQPSTERDSIPLRVSSGNTPNLLRVSPPENTKIAEGTTLRCGKWYVVTESDTCSGICQDNDICADGLLLKANPSLKKDDCQESLVPGVALCVAPISGWDSE